jgi:hypothetical protein
MNPRRLVIFAIIAVVVIALAVFLANRQTELRLTGEELLYPELKAQADSVKAIRIYKAGDARVVEILRNGAEWTLTERNGYPIAAAKARNLVRALSNAKILEEKTSDPTKYASLSVEDVESAEAKGVRIELEGPASPVNLIVGKDGPGANSSYVRRVGEQKSWLVSEQLSASPEPRDWLDKDIINVSADRVQSATIEIQGQKPYTASKASRADENFAVSPLPKGKELSYAGAANGFATALVSLTLDDVKPKAELADAKPAARATYRTFDGLKVEMQGYKLDDKHYLTLTTSYDAELADKFKVQTSAPADAEKKEGDAAESAESENKSEEGDAAAPDVSAEAQKVADKTANWVYEIPRYKYEAIFRPLDEMLKK